MKAYGYILTIIALTFLAVAPAPAQTTAATPLRDTVPPVPGLIWQKPLAASLTGLTVATGISPMLIEPMRRQNILFRENVQMWRRNTMDFRPLHFDNVIQLLPLSATVALSWCGVPSRHEGWPLVRRTASTLIVVTAVTQPLKGLVGEMRPDYSSTTSFPSGHTALAFSGAELLRLEYGQSSPWIPAAGFAIAALAGFMRIYNDRHWTGDVLAGAGIGIISADISYWLNNLIDRKWNK